ncbi:hypothetical protein JOQ06_002000 [Pogonophryne albipinna]|uniref:ZP-N domain-containing protein n=1 Tax=Pogonophryne albipinna TaxID=1090488 RepID=A0AAD6ABS8_9TELE|nr:hypothetical protein JOQ06_002000 [Pogonophryne albipinna]
MAASRLVLFWVLIVLRTAAGFLQEEEEGEPGSGVTETDLNETVLCSNDQMKVVIPSIFFLRKDPPVFVGDLHLNDPECRGVEVGEDYVFSIKTNLSDCGTVTVPPSTPSLYVTSAFKCYIASYCQMTLHMLFMKGEEEEEKVGHGENEALHLQKDHRLLKVSLCF